MNIGLLIVVGVVLLFAAYTAGIKAGIHYTSAAWLDYIKSAQVPRPSVADLYPEKKNE